MIYHDPQQALSNYFVLILLIIDYWGLFLSICLIIGLIRAYLRQTFTPMQYSCIFQLFCSLGFCVICIFSKHDLLYYNWSAKSLYFDHSDVNATFSTWIHYANASLAILCMLPIYVAGVCQIAALDSLLIDKASVVRDWVRERPTLFYSVGMVPGIVMLVLYWIEMNVRGISTPYSVNGAMITCYNTSYVGKGILTKVIIAYILAIFTTLYGLYCTLRTYKNLKVNFQRMIETAQKSGVSGYVVFQVLQIGYTMPIVGFVKGFELLIWIFPSVINVYYGTYGLVLSSITPLLVFINNGSHKNIYPLVPLFGGFLGAIYEKSSKEEAWNPFYSKGSTAEKSLNKSTTQKGTPSTAISVSVQE
ncbi:hypothetical protein HDV04_001697 [Boothiomyces sp. JEL0838]|nr:hypothetical protein HDV04_001697 [Boothiomyces sp. JEL0838]